MPADMPWRKAIVAVLQKGGGALHYKEIAEQIVVRGLRARVGATPAATVVAQLSASIKAEREKSPFVRTGKGEYALRGTAGLLLEPSEEDRPGSAEEEQYTIVTSFGMFWRRERVQWGPSAKLLGMQQIGAEPVNFSSQIGVYLLYDGREVIYVGRSTDRPLGRRLFEHTVDRLSTRWDRFSWFGLAPVSDAGKLGEVAPSFGSLLLIPALEAILIEALEPRQNRKRGDDLSAVEYFQHEDPELERVRMKANFNALLDRAQ